MRLHLSFQLYFGPTQVTLTAEQTVLPLVDEALQHTTTKGIAFQHPEIVADMDRVRQDLHLEPFYWKLPEQFEGKKVR
jgi:laminin alpha 1/2